MNPFTQPSQDWFYRLLQAICVAFALQLMFLVAGYLSSTLKTDIFRAAGSAAMLLIASKWISVANARFATPTHKLNTSFLVALLISSFLLWVLCARVHLPLPGLAPTILLLMGSYHIGSPAIAIDDVTEHDPKPSL